MFGCGGFFCLVGRWRRKWWGGLLFAACDGDHQDSKEAEESKEATKWVLSVIGATCTSTRREEWLGLDISAFFWFFTTFVRCGVRLGVTIFVTTIRVIAFGVVLWIGLLGFVADASFTTRTVSTFDTVAWIILTFSADTSTFVLTVDGSGVCTDIVFAGSVDTGFSSITGDAGAGICFAGCVDTAITSVACGAVLLALTGDGVTSLTFSAIFTTTWVVCTLPFDAEFTVSTSFFVTTGLGTFSIDTDRLAWTFGVDVTGAITCTLSFLAGVSCLTSDATTWVIDTLVTLTDAGATAVFFFTGVFDTLAFDADLVVSTCFVFTWVGGTFAFDTDLACGAEDSCT